MDSIAAEKLVLAEYAALCREQQHAPLLEGRASDAMERLGFTSALRLMGNLGNLPQDVADPFYRWQAELFYARLHQDALPQE